jgi:NTP pyrophosphatase (non-canonical NTP hydrolase)
MKLDDYQRLAYETDQNPRSGDAVSGEGSVEPRRQEVIPLLGLVGEVGSLLGEYKKLLRDGTTHRKFRDEVAEELGDILWYVANVATKYDLTLSDIARQNLEKAGDRFRNPIEARYLYDEKLPENQQLPRQFEYQFEERLVNGVTKLVLTDRNAGKVAGAALTDNAYEDDGYRFHDILHLTFAALLGWSPVLRKLLRDQKRIVNRTPSLVADVEDGGRAQVIEEAIVAAAYVYASDHDLLNGIDIVDWHLLRHIRELTAGVEVKKCSAWDWNNSLVRGFAIWRQLREHRGGVVVGNLQARTLEFSPSTPAQKAAPHA